MSVQGYEDFAGRAFSGRVEKKDEVGYHVRVQLGDRELVGYLVNHMPPRVTNDMKERIVAPERSDRNDKEDDGGHKDEDVNVELNVARKRAKARPLEKESLLARIQRELQIVEPIDRLKVRRRSVIVVGAGLAGIAAARALTGRGYSVKVLEARKRVGGRVFTDWSLGCPIDMGASYIHGSFGNPLCKLARELRLRLYVHSEEQCLLRERSTYIPEATQERADKVWEQIMSRVHEYSRRARRQSEKAESLAEILKRTRKETREMTTEEKDILDWRTYNLELLCGANLSQLSAQYWDYDDLYSFLGDHVMVRDGFSAITSALASEIEILCDSPVDRIERDVEIQTIGLLSKPFAFSPRRVPAEESGSTENSDRDRHLKMSECTTKGVGVRVQTKSGKVYLAESCIVTVPLGVLQRNEICFMPGLPSWKEDSIDAIGFGTANKVAMRFEEPFWVPMKDSEEGTQQNHQLNEDGPDYIGHVGGKKGEFCTFLSLYRCTGAPVLLVLAAGQSADTVEEKSDAQVLEYAMAALRKIYDNVPLRPIAYVISRWRSDQFSRGSYSYAKKGTHPNDFYRLSRPVGETLYFAGEATTKKHLATAHGAYMSGIREASRVLESGGFDDRVLAEFKMDLQKAADPIGHDIENRKIGWRSEYQGGTQLPLEAPRDRNIASPEEQLNIDRALRNAGRKGVAFQTGGGASKGRNESVEELHARARERQDHLHKQHMEDLCARRISVVKELNTAFRKTPFPTRSEIQDIANLIGTPFKDVEEWFMRRRMERNIFE